MKKRIDGTLYDTDEAERVARYRLHGSSAEFSPHKEDLYCTENDRWFLHLGGHAKSNYISVRTREGWEPDIYPLSEKEAYRWCKCKDKMEELKQKCSPHQFDSHQLDSGSRAEG